ncbi:type IV secretory system conjugative DNA transfer family protein [Erythrobacter sp. LQ02-29]|uniref:type IV secretory system conjugative DNA transfer family protein n=1 Tax=Erythrobacter sp. LQ02-29 TaxID=2920384 RepID=UPI001F4ECC4C|nr:type IV secretory system conjugative DNA transfer family protein [Erythrobacter sp. LQ02-29]MCP9223856.1 type IV secretory system conjugative DNA transfer family protein [Erythrobacter sp. LQ02-29]
MALRSKASSPWLWLAICVGLPLWLLIAGLGAVIAAGAFDPDINPLGIPSFVITNWHFDAVRKGFLIGAGGSAVIAALLAVLILRKPVKLHGDAHWATMTDIKKAGLLAPEGLLLAAYKGKILKLGGSEHVLVEAPTRAGKGVGIVVPNLLQWRDSAVILDIKRENWKLTAGYRAGLEQTVFMFDPLDPRSARFNPLAHIDRSDGESVINELQKIGTMLYPEPKNADTFWMDSARSAFIGLGAYVAAHHDEEGPGGYLPFTIGEVYRQATRANGKVWFSKIVAGTAKAIPPLSGPCVNALADYISSSDNTHSSIRQTLTSRINLWLSADVDRATSESDFDLGQLRSFKTSIYLCASPENIERVMPLYNLVLQQVIDRNVAELPNKKQHPYQVLLLMDEFARLGSAKMMAQAFSFVAGYGLRLMPVIQSRSQLKDIYGEHVAREIITNCGVEVIFGVKEDAIARELESRIGTYTFKARAKSRKPWDAFQGTITVSDQRRSLRNAREITDMSENKLLILRAATPAIEADKLRFYEIPKLEELSGIPPPALQLRRPAPGVDTHVAAPAPPSAAGLPFDPDEVPNGGAELQSWILANLYEVPEGKEKW